MKEIVLQNVSKYYSSEKAILKNFNLKIESGIFFTILGPSGCGKTTILRIIAGLEQVSQGQIFLGNLEITKLPPNKRKINTVFQKQALFPHMSVWQNIAYGLKIQNLSSEIIRKKVKQFIEIVNLSGLEQKLPEELSGGQQQRVALARAMIVEPDVLLFDEPLSALDLRLKDRLLIECAQIQKNTKTTFIYITHDQHEAMTVSDQIAVMNFDGEIEQIGTPEEIYKNPTSSFVADFIGNTTIFRGKILRKQDPDKCIIEIPSMGEINCELNSIKEDWISEQKEIFVSLRPENITLSLEPISNFSNSFKCEIANSTYSGKYTRYNVVTHGSYNVLVFSSDSSLQEAFVNQKKDFYINFSSKSIVILEK